jgi:hypothetical protein
MGLEGKGGRLRGKGLEQKNRKIAGSTREGDADSEYSNTELPRDLTGRTVIQRDNGEEWRVEEIKEGVGGKRIVHLSSLKERKYFNKNADTFFKEVNTPGSPWRLKD